MMHSYELQEIEAAVDELIGQILEAGDAAEAGRYYVRAKSVIAEACLQFGEVPDGEVNMRLVALIASARTAHRRAAARIVQGV